MPSTPFYDVNAVWEDPTDKRPELRAAARFPVRLKIKIALRVEESEAPLVGIGRVQDISTDGLYALTKHRLTAGDDVTLQFYTQGRPTDSGVGQYVFGSGRVVRVDRVDARRSMVAIQFGKSLSENIEFAIFADYLKSLSGIQNPS